MTGIDWGRPWLSHLLPVALRLDNDAEFLGSLNAAALAIGLKNHRQLPLRFVPQSRLPDGVAYETFIDQTGWVPTRTNHHDFFNGLIWLRFPKIKARLNALQAMEIERRLALSKEGSHQGAGRGGLRDAITIFDENAILFACADDGITRALRHHQWTEVFERRRETYGTQWTALAFGHALIEKLVNPYKAITAHAWSVPVGADFFALPVHEQVSELDLRISRQLSASLLTSNFFPLPVLGIPGWWPGQDHEFYCDPTVFRPQRSRLKS